MIRCCLPAFALVLLAASPAAGQLTIVLDQATYTVGETVEITVHNAGPTMAEFYGDPVFTIV